MAQPIRILVAPLDWGLGHATRCMPLITALEQAGVKPVLASAGVAGEYLQGERPDLPFFEWPAYDIRYRSHNMVLNMATQLPSILHAIRREHQQLQQIIRNQDIQAVISDNRYGCWSQEVPSIFVGHQLNLQLPLALRGAVNLVHRQLLRRFTKCWVPDEPGEGNLSGALSIPSTPLPLQHIGLLSRFAGHAEQPKAEKSIDALALLSGPEPQRSILEQEVLSQMLGGGGRYVIVGGKAGTEVQWKQENLRYYSRLNGAELLPLLAKARVVICRSGYSSLMDLATLGKHALLIPTPGQTEQIYLANRLQQQGKVAVQQQGKLQLLEGIERAQQLSGLHQRVQGKWRLKAAIAELLTLASTNSKDTLRSRF